MQTIALRAILLTLVFSFNARAADVTRWRFSRPIQFNTSEAGANVRGDVKEFPVAIALDARSFDFAQAKKDGSDVCFSGEREGAPLPHHVEHWDAEARAALVWVKVPLVRGNSTGQSIFMHWGNPDASNTGDAARVFSTADGWVAVWHLNEEGSADADGYKDATSNAAHGTGVNLKPGSRVDARLGKGQMLNYPDNQWIKVDGDKRKHSTSRAR